MQSGPGNPSFLQIFQTGTETLLLKKYYTGNYRGVSGHERESIAEPYSLFFFTVESGTGRNRFHITAARPPLFIVKNKLKYL